MILTKEDIRNDCPECNKVLLTKFGRIYNMIMFWGSVHGKCLYCGKELAYGCLDKEKEKFIIVTKEKFDEIRKSISRSKRARTTETVH